MPRDLWELQLYHGAARTLIERVFFLDFQVMAGYVLSRVGSAKLIGMTGTDGDGNYYVKGTKERSCDIFKRIAYE